MSTALDTRQKLYGLFELDAAGTVTYSRAVGEGTTDRPHPEFNGRNLFSETAPFLNGEELRRLVGEFWAGVAPAASVMFTCLYEDGPDQVRVLLARVLEQSDDKRTKSILLYIRKDS